MKITSLSINSHISRSLQLHSRPMSNLDRLVVVTGSNGCGKTRLFSAIDWLLNECLQHGYEKMKERLADLESPAHLYNSKPRKFDVGVYSYGGLMQSYEHDVAQLKASSGLELQFCADESETESLNNYMAVASFLKRPLEYTQNHIARLSIGTTRDLADISHQGLLSSPISYLLDVCKRVRQEIENEKAREGEINILAIQPWIGKRFEELSSMTKELLGLELSYSGQLGGIELSEISLSEGQARLLRWIVLFNSGALKEMRIPLLIDEPELHLHPHVINRLLDLMLECAPQCQIWIATHSISLVAHLAAIFPRSIWFGNAGEFINAGKDLPKVVEALLGGEGGGEKLIDYCVSAERFAFNAFAAECLIPPITVAYKSGDLQVRQVIDAIRENYKRAVNLLDFGAGQGRLLDGLVEHVVQNQRKFDEFFSYYALEPDADTRALCIEKVSSHYSDAQKRVFSDPQDVCNNSSKFDLVVMANLLHEIPASAWVSSIFKGEVLRSSLNDDGYVLLIEDTLLPTGELAHNCGFLILEQPALKKLFKVTEQDVKDQRFVSRASPDNRLQATLIGKEFFERTDHSTMIEAMEWQYHSAIDAIKELRSRAGSLSYMDGRRHAYLTQLATNMKLAVEELEVVSDTKSTLIDL